MSDEALLPTEFGKGFVPNFHLSLPLRQTEPFPRTATVSHDERETRWKHRFICDVFTLCGFPGTAAPRKIILMKVHACTMSVILSELHSHRPTWRVPDTTSMIDTNCLHVIEFCSLISHGSLFLLSLIPFHRLWLLAGQMCTHLNIQIIFNGTLGPSAMSAPAMWRMMQATFALPFITILHLEDF
jgi:hypothetical protein